MSFRSSHRRKHRIVKAAIAASAATALAGVFLASQANAAPTKYVMLNTPSGVGCAIVTIANSGHWSYLSSTEGLHAGWNGTGMSAAPGDTLNVGLFTQTCNHEEDGSLVAKHQFQVKSDNYQDAWIDASGLPIYDDTVTSPNG